MSSDAEILRGIEKVINISNVKTGLNYDEIAKEIIEESSGQPATSVEDDPNTLAKREMDKLAADLGIDNFSTPLPRMGTAGGTGGNTHGSATGGTPSLFTPSKLRTAYSPNAGTSPVGMQSPISTGATTPDSEQPEFGIPADSPIPRRIYSQDIHSRTIDEQMHSDTVQVMNRFGGDKKFISLEEEEKEDQKVEMIDRIESLRQALIDEGELPENLPNAGKDDDYATVSNILRRLELKYDRIRYTAVADESIIFASSLIEDIFDGERSILGRKPNMKGWSREVQVKTRRMRLETGSIVGKVMRKLDIGPFMRIIMELIPSGILYARRNKGRPQRDSMAAYINNIRNNE